MSAGNDKHEIEEIDCIEAINEMYAYLDGELDDKESIERLEHHMSHCRSCYSRREFEAQLTRRIKESAKKQTPESLKNRMHHLIDKF